jgi:hypothetical protein
VPFFATFSLPVYVFALILLAVQGAQRGAGIQESSR